MNQTENTEQAKEKTAEANAEEALEELLENPDYQFLQIPKNIERIDNASTAVEALDIALDLIAERLQRSFEFRAIREVEEFEFLEVNLEGVKSVIDRIKEEQVQIGKGGDGYVVVSKNEIENYPPVICYKFAMKEKTPRGRNPMALEAEIQGEYFDFAVSLPESKIAVPMPYYVTEVGVDKVIAMEKLPAKSVDDILRGMGSLPDWLDLDVFCDELSAFLVESHKQGLYHRDMHVGNVMVTQSPDEPENGKWGYVIDFGLSGRGHEGMDPYRKEQAGEIYTYSQDERIVEEIRRKLKSYRSRNAGKA